MKQNLKNQIKKQAGGFSLVEVMIGLGVASVFMVAIQNFIPKSITVANNASDQAAATIMMSSIVQDLRNTRSDASVSPGLGIPLPIDTMASTNLMSTNIYLSPGGGVISQSQARYAATVWLSNSASATVTSLTTVHVKVYWPTVGTTQGSVESITSFNRQLQRGGVYIASKAGGSATNTTTGCTTGGSTGGGPICGGHHCGDPDGYGHCWGDDDGHGHYYGEDDGCGDGHYYGEDDGCGHQWGESDDDDGEYGCFHDCGNDSNHGNPYGCGKGSWGGGCGSGGGGCDDGGCGDEENNGCGQDR